MLIKKKEISGKMKNNITVLDGWTFSVKKNLFRREQHQLAFIT